MNHATIYILIIVFLATLVRSTVGFGESLVAVPLLLLFIPVETAVPLSVMVSVTIAAVVVVQDHRHIHFQSAKWLIVFAVLGIPFGIYILIHGNEHIVKAGLGFLIILHSIYALTWKRSFRLAKDKIAWLFICGFFSGVLGGAYGLNGPPLAVYGNIRGWTAKHFRATLQAYFLPASIFGMAGYWYQGLWTIDVTHYFFMSVPVIIPAIFLGRFFNHRLKDETFLKSIYFGLIITGLLLLFQSFIK